MRFNIIISYSNLKEKFDELKFFYFRDPGVTAIEKLMEKRGKFDYILLETTGLADPGLNTLFTKRIRFKKE